MDAVTVDRDSRAVVVSKLRSTLRIKPVYFYSDGLEPAGYNLAKSPI